MIRYLALSLVSISYALTIAHPPNYGFVHGQLTQVIGNTPHNAAFIKINDQLSRLEGSRFAITTPLTLGKNTLTITTYDARRRPLSTQTRQVIAKQRFNDISPLPQPLQTTISDLATIGFFKIEDTSFKAEKPISRYELAKYLTTPTSPSPRIHLTDISKTDTAYPYISTAIQNNYLTPYADRSFRPYRYVTRAEAIVSLMRYTKISPQPTQHAPYTDIPATHWAANAIATAKALNWLPNTQTFDPNAYFTRLDLAKIAAKLPHLTHRIATAYHWDI